MTHCTATRSNRIRATAALAALALAAATFAACGSSGDDGPDAARPGGCGIRNSATGEVEFCSPAGNEVCVCATGRCAQIDLSCASSYRYVEGAANCVSADDSATFIESRSEADLCPVLDADAHADADDAGDGDGEVDGDGDGVEVGPLCGNGVIDPGEDCDGDPPEPCTTSCGSTGSSVCVACRWEACVAPAEECNSADDNCDGVTDEEFECVATRTEACTTSCGSEGQRACSMACAWQDCVPPEETCNGIDDDCDDACDDTFDCCAGESGDCTTSCGSVGTRSCSADCGWQECIPPVESCNGVDDDCNSMTDEVAGGFACGDGCCNGTETYCSCPGDCTTVVPPPAAPRPLWPWNGALSGSFRVSASLRPTFRWAPSDSGGCGSATYDIQVDDSCTTPSFSGCTLLTPTAWATGLSVTSWTPAATLDVATLPPVGRRYYWRVRACDGAAGCSSWSPVRYLDVGRVPSDFNGDGLSDLAVGVPGYDDIDNPNTGAVYLYLSNLSGLPATFTRRIVADVLQPGLAFGWTAAAGDLNADGFAELLVGAPGRSAGSTGEGGVYVFRGGSSGPGTSPWLVFDHPRGTAGASFGTSLAVVGDVNGDGYFDFAAGSPMEAVGVVPAAGRIDFVAGPPSLSLPPEALTAPVPVSGGAFGQSIAGLGDALGNGTAVFMAGAPGQAGSASGEGTVFVFRWDRLAVDTAPWATLSCPEPCSDGHFGSSAALIGDLGDDGYPDFAVGAPMYDAGAVREGNVFVYAVTSAGLADLPVQTLDNPDNTPMAFFGTALAPTGRIGSVGQLGLLVGAPQQISGSIVEGAVYWYGGRTALVSTPSTLAAPDADGGGAFGASATGGLDFTGNGNSDVVIGAPGRDGTAIQEGRAFVYESGYGMLGGLPPTPTRTLNNPLPYPGDQFGFSLQGVCY